MPSLVIANTVQLNYKDGKIYVQDTSSYAAGIANNIVGIIKVTQPDGITREGDWNSPDVYYNSGSLVIGQVELRTQSNGKPQQGTYIVEYTVDHPSYTPTTLTRTFVLSYEGVTPAITRDFDVFTPNLSVTDSTDYQKGGFNTPTISRAWIAVIGSVGTKAGTASSLDLAYSSAYYDAAYTITLTSELTYQHSTYSYLSVVDRRTTTLETTADTPPSYDTLKAYLKIIKDNFDNLTTCNTKDARDDYEYASALLAQIKSRLCDSDLVNLDEQIVDFLNVYHGHITVSYVNTNAPIPAYDYTNVDCGNGGTPGTTDSRITNQMISNWNDAYASIPPDDLEFIVGITAGAPLAGDSTFTLAALAGWRVRLILNRIPQSQIQFNSDYYYTKDKASDTLTMNGYTWQTGDLIQIQRF